MTEHKLPPRLGGLSDLADRYDLLLCDAWGVVHNGKWSYRPAIEALSAWRALGKQAMIVTNAPRPEPTLQKLFDQLGVDHSAYDRIISSGDAARERLKQVTGGRVHWLGAAHDRTLVEGIGLTLTDAEHAAAVLISDFETPEQTVDDLRERMADWKARDLPLICANPDLVVERGDKMFVCAGAVAAAYAEMGGETILAGKPHRPIYETALDAAGKITGRVPDLSRTLAIGDGARTDAAGAAGLGVDLLFITGSIHAAELGPRDNPDAAAVADLLAPTGVNVIGFMPDLVWQSNAPT